jgi:hypothetical protein
VVKELERVVRIEMVLWDRRISVEQLGAWLYRPTRNLFRARFCGSCLDIGTTHMMGMR